MSSLIGDLKYLAQNPAEVNVVDSETFHNRICNVFNEISGILERSAGPCGAPTVISIPLRKILCMITTRGTWIR